MPRVTIKQLQEDIERLNADNERLTRSLEEYRVVLPQVTKTLTLVTAERNEAEKQNAILASQNNSLRNRLQCALHNGINKQRKVFALQKEVTQLNADKQRLVEDVAELHHSVSLSETAADQLYDECGVLKRKYEAVVQDMAGVAFELKREREAHTRTTDYLTERVAECEDLRNNEPGIWTLERASLVRTIERLRGEQEISADAPADYCRVQYDTGGYAYEYYTRGLLLFPGDKVQVPVTRKWRKSGSYTTRDNVVTATVVSTHNHKEYSGPVKAVLGLAADCQSRVERTMQAKVNQLLEDNRTLETYLDHQTSKVETFMRLWETAKKERDTAQARVALIKRAADKWTYNGIGRLSVALAGRDHAQVNEDRVWYLVNTVGEWS